MVVEAWLSKEERCEMMGACSKILIQGLRKEGSRGDGKKDDVELGEMPRVMNVATRPEDVTQPEESREGFGMEAMWKCSVKRSNPRMIGELWSWSLRRDDGETFKSQKK